MYNIRMSFNEALRMPQNQGIKEKIRNAAILYKGKIFEGASHGHAFGELLRDLKITDPDLFKKVHGDEFELVSVLEREEGGSANFEGFVTNTGRYVLRSEATVIAERARQLKKTKSSGSDLYSEDLVG